MFIIRLAVSLHCCETWFVTPEEGRKTESVWEQSVEEWRNDRMLEKITRKASVALWSNVIRTNRYEDVIDGMYNMLGEIRNILKIELRNVDGTAYPRDIDVYEGMILQFDLREYMKCIWLAQNRVKWRNFINRFVVLQLH